MNAQREQGFAVYETLRGPERAQQMASDIASKRFGASMTGLAIDFVFGNVWGRSSLDRRSRSLVTLGVLIASRQPDELKNHIHIAMTNGLTAAELEEVMIQAAAYAGFPAAHVAAKAAADVLDSLAREPTAPKQAG
jgi:4-carboxymuconolactone decarboxylase